MLEYLRVRGLALLDDVALELHPGMNVLTGETGAGKSILVDALALVRGGRARADLVREGASRAHVEAQFAVAGPAQLRLAAVLAAHGADPDGGDGSCVVLERVIGRGGRGRAVVQGSLTTLAVLAEVGEQLVDICSQHEHHSLARVARHLDLLDAFAGTGDLRGEYEGAYASWRAARAAHEQLRAAAAERAARADWLEFQLDELERVDPRPGEHEALAARVEILRDAGRWQEFAHRAAESLYQGDDAIADRLAGMIEEARRRSGDSGTLAELEEQLEVARIACEEAAGAAGRLAREVELEPGELVHVEERLEQLERLRRKHGCDPAELPERAASMRAEADELRRTAERIEQLAALASDRERGARALAGRLHAGRLRAAKELGASIQAELTELHMPDARVEVEVERLEDGELGPHGSDRVELRFSANAGEPPAPLARVASGGELSRVLLAVRGALATGGVVETYVFDEIDAGVGGAVAEAIGRRLWRAARTHQILCITHLPQIAAFAEAHFRVDKVVEGGRTVTRVQRLEEGARVEELARMLGGAKVTASAREHARQLRAAAAQPG